MQQKNILIVAPYPIANPLHGGQKRADAIFKFYKTITAEVKFVGVFHRGQYPDWGKDDILLGQPDLIKKIDENPYASELISGKAIDNDIHVRSHFAKLLMEFQPDIIHIEQPYPYLGLEPLLLELGMSPKIVLGSQNIEYVMKQRIYEGLEIAPEIRDPLVAQTKQLEEKFSKKADLIIAVNEQDAADHKKMGAKKCVVVPNGIDSKVASKAASGYWDKIKKEKSISKIVTFVGSGHPPNWVGFLGMIGADLSFIPKDCKIFIVGGVADYFEKEFEDKEKYSSFWSGAEIAGKIDDDKLAGLLEVSDVVLLPISIGGGSNLKTAEAILSGKKIVATPYAFHGFEKFRNLPNIFVADNKDDFREALTEALNAEYQAPTDAEKKLSEKVQWKYCLEPLRIVLGIRDTPYARLTKAFSHRKHALVIWTKRALSKLR